MKTSHVWIVLGIGVLLVIALGIGYLLPRPLIRWVSPSSAFQDGKNTSFEDGEEVGADVLIMPVDTFRYEYANELAGELSTRTGLRVKAMLPTPLDGIQPFPGTKQFSAADIMTVVERPIERLRSDYGASTVIVLTNRDINQPERLTRFVFSFNDPNQQVSILSSARLALGDATQVAELSVIKERILKFSLRCIAEQHFKLPRSTDEKSVMFSPIMSLKDVDRMGMAVPNEE